MPIILSFCNKKGGCAKTTAAVNVAAILASRGKRILLIDADEQGNASAYLGAKLLGKRMARTLYDALVKERRVEEVVIQTEFENLDILVGDSQLGKINTEMTQDPGAPMLLKDWLEGNDISSYDYIIIDTNPAINLMFYNALNASHYFALPIFPEADSFDGVGMMFEAIGKIKKKSNKMLDFLGIIITRKNEKNGTHKAFMKKIQEFADNHSYAILGIIPESTAVAGASASKKPLIHYKDDLPVTEAYKSLASGLVKELKPLRGRPSTFAVPKKEFEELATYEVKPNEVEISFD